MLLCGFGCLAISEVAAGSRFTVTGYAESTVVGGTDARWLRHAPGGKALLLVLVQADRPGFDRTGRVRWIVQTDGRRLPDGTPVATLEGVITRPDLWPTELTLDPARFAGQGDDRYPSSEELPPMAILVESRMVQPDADGDGVPDTSDAFPYDRQESLDTDEDGKGNNLDPDDDGDLIPDDYEAAHHLNPLLTDALPDLDGDGRSNLDEYRAGTAADNAASLFRIDGVSFPTPGRIRLEWQGVPGRVYTLFQLPALNALLEVIATDVSVDAAGPVSREFDSDPDSVSLFYLLQVRVR